MSQSENKGELLKNRKKENTIKKQPSFTQNIVEGRHKSRLIARRMKTKSLIQTGKTIRKNTYTCTTIFICSRYNNV